MTNLNAFRPTLTDLEGRSLMSATLTAPVYEAARVSSYDVIVTKTADEPTQTREHILLARQVGVATDDGSASGHHALYQDVTIPTNATAGKDYLLELDGIKGESADRK